MARTTTLTITPEMQRLKDEILAIDERLPRYPMQVMYLLMFAATIEAFDRSLVGIVLEDIRREFNATDGQLGFLTGAFGFMAALGVIPLGILTDRVKRVRIIAWGFLPWGIAMILQGLAPTFALFFLARMLNGALEATGGQEAPAPVSLVGDYYPVEDRTRIYGVQGMGQILGYAAGPIFGGITANIFGWRGSFVFWGIFGLGTGLVLYALLPEPPRALQDAKYRLQTRYMQLRLAQRRADFGEDSVGQTAAERQMLAAHDNQEDPEAIAARAAALAGIDPSELNKFDYRNITASDATKAVLRIKTFWLINVLVVFQVFGTAGVATWMPTFFRRYHGMSVTGAAVVSAFNATTALVGVYGGARIGAVLVKAGKPHLRFVLVSIGYLGVGVLWGTCILTNFTPYSIHFFFYGSICITTPIGILLAVRADIIHPHLRGRAASVASPPRIVATLVAPIFFGLLSDSIGLRSALLTLVPLYFIMTGLALFGLKFYDHDAAVMQAESVRQHTLEQAERRAGGGEIDEAERIAAEFLAKTDNDSTD